MMKLSRAFGLAALLTLAPAMAAADTIVFSEVKVARPNATIEFVVNTEKEISTFHKSEIQVRSNTGEVVFQYKDDVLYIKKGILQFPAQFAEGVRRFHQVGVAHELKRGKEYLVFRSATADMEYSVSILIK